MFRNGHLSGKTTIQIQGSDRFKNHDNSSLWGEGEDTQKWLHGWATKFCFLACVVSLPHKELLSCIGFVSLDVFLFYFTIKIFLKIITQFLPSRSSESSEGEGGESNLL